MKTLLLLPAFLLFSCAAIAEPGPLMMDGVSVSNTHIFFGQGGDIWSVPIAGGMATQLTDDAREDRRPHVSPDGRWVAFCRSERFDLDIYVVSADGGEPRRITWHPKQDVVQGWSPDGARILFRSGRHGDGLDRLFTVAADGSDTPVVLPIPTGHSATFSPDGKQLAYAPVGWSHVHNHWRYYRGGMTSPLWLLNLADSKVTVVKGNDANHLNQMWHGDTLYYTSDESGTYNLYQHNLKDGKTKRLTKVRDYGVTHAGISPDGQTIAYFAGGRLFRFDTSSGKSSPISVELKRDMPARSAKSVPLDDWAETISLGPDGSMLIYARGDVLRMVDGVMQNLTESSDAADRYPTASPDGKTIAYFSDRSGEYQLVLHDIATGAEKELKIEKKPSFYRQPVWSPDSKRLAFTGRRLGLWLADVEKQRIEKIVTSDYLAQELYEPSWAPGGQYLAYELGTPDHLRSIWIYDVAADEHHRVTSETHATRPVFDPNGKYLYYFGSNTAAMFAASEIWGLMSANWGSPMITRKLHCVVLDKDEFAPSLPLLGDPRDGVDVTTAATETHIDFGGLGERIVPIRITPRDYVALESAGPGRLVLQHLKHPETPNGREPILTPLWLVSFSAETAHEELVADVDAFELAPNGLELLYISSGVLYRQDIEIGASPDTLFLEGELQVNPEEEWTQIFHETQRIMRDWFYDDDHHGTDLEKIEAHYAAFLPSITDRWQLNRLTRHMLGEVSTSHMGTSGGDGGRPAGRNRTASLGAEFEVAEGRFRITKVFRNGRAEAANALVSAAPLDQPGMNVKVGEYLIAIDDANVVADRNLFSYLEGKAFRPLKITLSASADGNGSRSFIVIAGAGENSVRMEDFFAERRRMVEELSGGRLGYIDMRTFGSGSIEEFMRQFVAASSKEGLIIDQRFNGGGTTSDGLIEILQRERLHRYAMNYGDDLTVPTSVVPGPRVLIINEGNFSAAETFPLMFQIAKVGTIVGKRTGGGGIGPALFRPSSIDGGRTTIPIRSAYNPLTGAWAENIGIVPDIEVEMWPDAWRDGRDPQIEKAVEVALAQLRKVKVQPPRMDPYPVHPR